jgi:hypothetical protein
MTARFRPLFAFLAFVALTRAAERDVVRTFPLPPGGTVSIDTFRGSITVTESDEPRVRVAVHLAIGGDTAAAAERVGRELQLTFADGANSVSVVARHPQETGARFVWRDNEQIEPTFRVTVPRRCNVDLKTLNGSIIVGNLSGRLVARVETGDIFFRHVAGSVDAATQEGDVVVSQCDGTVKARVLMGTIQLGVIAGPCEARNASGGIEVMAAKAGIRARAEAGNVVVGFPRDCVGQSELTTSGGSVIAKIDPAAKCGIEASTSWFSHIDCRLPALTPARRPSRRYIVGALNGGGAAHLRLRASGGNVAILPGETPFGAGASASHLSTGAAPE